MGKEADVASRASVLEAGPELDALVAEKVMGWEPEEVDPHAGELRYWSTTNEGCVSTGLPQSLFNFSPSTDIADAMEVLEKVLVRIESIYPSHDPEDWRFLHWVVVVRKGADARRGFVAETLALAICLAALEAVEGDADVA